MPKTSVCDDAYYFFFEKKNKNGNDKFMMTNELELFQVDTGARSQWKSLLPALLVRDDVVPPWFVHAQKASTNALGHAFFSAWQANLA